MVSLLQVLPALLQRCSDQSGQVREVTVTAIKAAIVPQPHSIDDPLRSCIAPFLDLVSDEDRYPSEHCTAAPSPFVSAYHVQHCTTLSATSNTEAHCTLARLIWSSSVESSVHVESMR